MKNFASAGRGVLAIAVADTGLLASASMRDLRLKITAWFTGRIRSSSDLRSGLFST